MSIPAVLYDHVPVDDLQDEGGRLNGMDGLGFYVSSMVHRTSAPREDSNQFQQSRFAEHGKRSNESKDGVVKNEEEDGGGDVGEYENDSDTIGDVEIHDHPMETIFEEIDSDYVLIPPIPPPTICGEDDSVLRSISRKSINSLRKKIRACGRALLGATSNSSDSSHGQKTHFWKDNDTVTKCLSVCAMGSRALLKPFQFYVRDLVFPSIYSSYDWISETVIDSSGNRLILPGSCVALDSENFRNSSTDGGSKYSGTNHDKGMLIVPAALDDVGPQRGIESSSSIPVARQSSPSSLWTSNTIMVSAHDLLAVKHGQCMQLGDGDDVRPLSLFDVMEEEDKGKAHHSRYYYRDREYDIDRSIIIVAKTENVPQQWIRALWKLAHRKANLWYYNSRTYLRWSIQNVSRPFFYSQHFLIQYYKNKHKRNYCLLGTSSNGGNENSEGDSRNVDYDEDRGTEEETSRLMLLSEPPHKLSYHRSYDAQKSCDETMTGCDLTVSGFIEMTRPISNSRNEYSA